MQSEWIRNCSPLHMPGRAVLGALSMGFYVREQAKREAKPIADAVLGAIGIIYLAKYGENTTPDI